jgi:hypothetical protein
VGLRNEELDFIPNRTEQLGLDLYSVNAGLKSSLGPRLTLLRNAVFLLNPSTQILE